MRKTEYAFSERISAVFFRNLSVFILILSSSVLFSQNLFAESEGLLNKLLAPGPLIHGHKDLEKKDCLKCHEGGKGVPDNKCLECHKELKASVLHKKGFHGLVQKSCRECHTDHKGRDFDSVFIDEKKFDHGLLTGYKLEGKHSEIKCAECHKDKRTKKVLRPRDIRYVSKQAACVSCHKKDDVHFYSGEFAKKDCNACHSLDSWKKNINFDHSTATHFKLGGKHAEKKCNDCHMIDKKKKTFQYKWAELAKKECMLCHNDTEHRFSLQGHFAVVPSYKLGNLNKCSTCHNDKSWKEPENFDHNKSTRYPIDGKHEELTCKDCHLHTDKKNPKAKPPAVGIYHWEQLNTKTCENCHKTPHIGKFSKALLTKKCTECHTTDSWFSMKNKDGFDHSKTRFDLTGAHKDIRCADCHGAQGKQNFKFKSVDQKFCIDCHKNIHENEFKTKFNITNCSECHNTSKFSELKNFDHNQTQYKLTESHVKVQCSECHKPTDVIRVLISPNTNKRINPNGKNTLMPLMSFPHLKDRECNTCHADYHKDQLSLKCDNCHTNTKWKDVKFDHNTQSVFKLLGLHAKKKCSECHKPIPGQVTSYKPNLVSRPLIRFKPLGQMCIDCHKDEHKGLYGKKCQDCHTETGWKTTKNFHKNFSLTGVHYAMECSECHKDGKKLAGLSQQCIVCHLKDDIHNGTLPSCKECHQQQFWEIPSFRHSMSRFPLRGAHRTLACSDCHINGVYKGLDSTCSTCHWQDAAAATSKNHNSPNITRSDCTECHRQMFSFMGAH